MNKHQEDTKYLQWQDGMYVMLDELLCDYEKALVEDSLRRSVYFDLSELFNVLDGMREDRLGVSGGSSGLWRAVDKTKLTREQALYIATGDTTCTGY
jgi:hypothetical protein